MRIALITPAFSADDADWCIPVLQDLARGLHARHQVTVFSISYPLRIDSYEVKGVPVQSFGDNRLTRVGMIKRIARAVSALAAAHAQSPFDIAHAFWSDLGGPVAALAHAKLRVPYVTTIMGGELSAIPALGYGRGRKFPDAYVSRLVMRYAEAVTTLSPAFQSQLAPVFANNRITCLPFGADTELFSKQGSRVELQGERKLLVVGSLVPVKGHADLLHAFRATSPAATGAHLHIVGDGILKAELQNAAKALGVANHVTFHGHVDHAALPAFFRAADACLLGSYHETCGMVVLEAGACAKLTVGTRVGILPELTPSQLLAEPGDRTRLAEAIDAASRNTETFADAAATVAEKVRLRFTTAHMVDSYEALYLRALEHGRS